MGTPREDAFDNRVVVAADRVMGVLRHPTAEVLNVTHGGAIMGNIDSSRTAVLAQVGNLAGAVNALAKGEVYDPAKMTAGITKVINEGFAKQAASMRDQITAALDAADIDGQVKAGLMSTIKGITYTDTATFDLKEA